MTQTAFNAAATDFATEVAKAESDFAKNPADTAALEKLAFRLTRRLRHQGVDILERTSTAASFANLGESVKRMNAAIETLESAAPENAAAAMDTFATTVTTELDGAITGITDNRAQVVYFRESNAEIKADAETFVAAVDRLIAKAGDAAPEKLGTVKSEAGDVVENTGYQDPLLEGMQLACDEQIGKVESLKAAIDGQRQRFQGAADMARNMRETVDACLNGVKAPVNVRKKPVSFRTPQA